MAFLYRIIIVFLFLFGYKNALQAQVGQYRNMLSVGFNTGYVSSKVSFIPIVTQQQHGGLTAGLSLKYVCEKYFNTICSVYGELNYASLGWKENIVDANKNVVINAITNMPETYERNIGYLQMPVFAHLAWGKERKGAQFFFKVGPQFGLLLSESTKTNFDFKSLNLKDRLNKTTAQDTMKVENNFDYGIAAGLGVEYFVPKVGHFLLEGRYYYGLGNIYGDRKKDFFARSNHNSIVVKVSYLFDLTKTKK